MLLSTEIVVDWSVRCETPAGEVGQVRPHRCFAPRRLTAHPAESEHPEAEINECTLLYAKQQRFANKAKKNDVIYIYQGSLYSKRMIERA